jgi:methanol--5-hydroxybenzimidazolylcobamide Co-methyltransferase
LTIHPEWGEAVTQILVSELQKSGAKNGIKTALRVTPNDIREFARPPIMRSGFYVDQMFSSFERCAQAGADFLSIESTGGKEIHDEAILNGDLALSVFSLSVLGARDMRFLWEKIVTLSHRYEVIPAGDSACGFANTAMVLAEQHFIPQVWAAIIRVLSVPRSLVAYEQGALGPCKDCAYEGPFIKAITGVPIALEGAEAACAHLSPIGNIAKAVPDLWSNESVNNVKLLGGMAPTVSLEQLAYATRLMNTAGLDGLHGKLQLRDWFVNSDARFDPQAYVLKPDVVLRLSGLIASGTNPYERTRLAALGVTDELRKAVANGILKLSKMEQRWLDRLSKDADALAESEMVFVENMIPKMNLEKVSLTEYGL